MKILYSDRNIAVCIKPVGLDSEHALPDALKEASSLAKMLGDTAAHDKELEIDQYDVEAMAEFIGFIIEYLYVVPDKISAYKVRLDAKTTSENNT